MAVLDVLFLIACWTWIISAALFLRNTVLPRVPILQTPGACGLPAQPVRFDAADGMRLEGWKIPGHPDRPWIIGCHGLGASRADLLEIAAGLHQAGFNVFLFDFRAHGASAGRVTSFGWREQRDLEGALAFLGQQPDAPPRPYGLYGLSMGAAVGLMVAARDERIGAVAADSPYTDLKASLGHHLTLMYPLPRVPFVWFVLATYRLRFGVWPSRMSPLEAVATLSPRPLLLIQGEQDPRMPLEAAKKLFEKAREPKTLWVIRGTGHLQGFAANPQAYLDHLTSFFNSSLI